MKSLTTADCLEQFRWEPVPLRSVAQENAGLIGGEGLQQVHAIVYAESDPNIVYFSTDTSQVWKSDDGGSSWQPMHKGFGAHGARSLLVDPVNANIVFAAGFGGTRPKEKTIYPNHLQGIFRTTDGGKNWILVRKADFFKQDSKGCLFAFDSTTKTATSTPVVYSGTYNEGLLRSNNGGDSWVNVGFAGQHIIDIKEDPAKPGGLLVATQGGLYRFLNGNTLRIGNDLPGWPRSIAVSKSAPSIIYAALGDKGVYKSTDGGNTFFKIYTGFPQSTFFSDIAISPINPNLVYLRADRSSLPPLYSHDGGVHWQMPDSTDVGNLIPNEGFFFSSPFAVHPTIEKTAITSSNGKARILKAIDGGKHWQYSGNGFTGGHVEDIAFYGPGKMIFALTDFGLWQTEDNGSTFKELPVKRIMDLLSSSSVGVRGSTIIASIGTWFDKGLVVSHDGGSSWNYFREQKSRYKYIAFHPKAEGVVYAGPYRSIDNGRSWKKLHYSIRALDPNDGNIVYAFEGHYHQFCDLLRSKDRGMTWHKQACPFDLRDVQDIAVSPDCRVYVATSGGIWISDGDSWRVKNERNGLTKDKAGMCFISSVEIDPKNSSYIYATRRSPGYGKSNGIFRSMDRGEMWQNISGNLGDEFSAWTVKIDPFNGAVYIGTYLGTWRMATIK